MVESLGDYFAAADISGAPVPPPSVISRAVALQGATCALAGVWGTTSGTTAYNEVGPSLRSMHVAYCLLFVIVVGSQTGMQVSMRSRKAL